MLDLFLAAYIVLHSSLDKQSRDFVNSLSSGDHQIIDWYTDESRYQYDGPPPSAFPTVVIDLPDGNQGTVRQPASWADVEAAEADSSKCETIAERGQYLGGVALEQVTPLLKSGVMTSRDEAVLREAVSEYKRKIDERFLELQSNNLVSKDQAKAMEALRDIAARASFVRELEKQLAD